MKTIKYFAYALLIGSACSFAACSDDDPVQKGETVIRGEKCRIESFVLTLGDKTQIAGDVYEYDKSIDIAYNTEQIEALKQATATVKLSEGATITPDPQVAADYTQPVQFTVTGADGKTTRTYTTKPIEKVVVTVTKIAAAAEKSANDMGISDFAKFQSIGICNDKVVIGTKVFDGKTLAPVGDLNMTGFTDKVLTCLTNDDAGHLIASITADGQNSSAPSAHICWKNGYDKPAEMLIESKEGAIAGFISASGDVTKGKALVTALGARNEVGSNFCWGFTDGKRDNYYNLSTGQPSNDGSWSQMVSPCTGEVTGRWFMWDAVNGGSNVLTWEGWEGKGTVSVVTPIKGNAPNGPHNWGNYTKGSLRSFSFNKEFYTAAFTTGWPCTYVSIVDANGNFVLNAAEATLNFPISDANPYCPVGAYIFNAKEQCGYLYVLIPGYLVKSWKLTVSAE